MDPVLSGTVPAVDPDRSEADPAADPEIFEEPTAAVLICPAGVVPLCKLPYHGLI